MIENDPFLSYVSFFLKKNCPFNLLGEKTMVLWVFGYGSLVWNPGFDFDEKIIGFIRDYRRSFDLGRILLVKRIIRNYKLFLTARC